MANLIQSTEAEMIARDFAPRRPSRRGQRSGTGASGHRCGRGA